MSDKPDINREAVEEELGMALSLEHRRKIKDIVHALLDRNGKLERVVAFFKDEHLDTHEADCLCAACESLKQLEE